MSANNIEVPPDKLLWRTRGLQWEYCFLLTPEIDRGSWWRFYREVKAELSLSANGDQIVGKLKDRSGTEHTYLASIFLDDKAVDSAGRSTEQFVVWFPGCEITTQPINLAKSVAGHFFSTIKSGELAQCTDDSEPGPEQIFSKLPICSSPIPVEGQESVEIRKVELYHQADGDLTVVPTKKRPNIVGIILALAGALGAILTAVIIL